MMNRQWFLVGGIVAVLIGLVGAGWLVRDRFLPVEVGTRVPDFSARDLSGEEVSLSDLEGEVILLNIWATWCPPCREEMPSMQRLHEELGPEGLRIVAVSVDVAPGMLDASGNVGGNIAEFAREMGLTFAIWHDPSGRVQQAFRSSKVPESFVIDRSGYIVKKDIGGVIWDTDARIDLFRRLLEQ
jgi:cytochrome c biogenesis protein CcmG, thiol:disulfide interchange protein DsbE